MSRHEPESVDLPDLDERALRRRLQAGDEGLFEQVVTAFTPLLTRLARDYTATDAAAQDAVQDAWLVVVDKIDGFAGRSTLKTWVCGILVNTARRSGVREARTVPFSSAWRDDRGPAVEPARFSRAPGPRGGEWLVPPVRWDEIPEERLATGELRSVIQAAIASLPARQREVITARDVLGLEAAEVAEALGLSSGNQRVLLHRARGKVRAALEGYAAESAGPPAEPAACAAEAAGVAVARSDPFPS